jgi:hypothetical protein
LRQVAEFMAFLKFRMRLRPTATLDDAQLAALYAADADEDQALSEAGLAEYVQGLCQEDVHDRATEFLSEIGRKIKQVA